jgi:hypothetical protein
MSTVSESVQVPPADDLVLKFTVDQLRESINCLHTDNLTIFVVAWRINRQSPHHAVAVGSVFAHTSGLGARGELVTPRTILGREPSDPARLRVNLLTIPDGPVESWTADQVSLMAMELDLPAVPPWVPTAVTYRLIKRRRIAAEVGFKTLCQPK